MDSIIGFVSLSQLEISKSAEKEAEKAAEKAVVKKSPLSYLSGSLISALFLWFGDQHHLAHHWLLQRQTTPLQPANSSIHCYGCENIINRQWLPRYIHLWLDQHRFVFALHPLTPTY